MVSFFALTQSSLGSVRLGSIRCGVQANEMNRILEAHGATCGPTPGTPSLVDLQVLTVDLPEIQEVDTMAIAKNKAILGSQLAGGPCVVEDTSLQFRALGGMPVRWKLQIIYRGVGQGGYQCHRTLTLRSFKFTQGPYIKWFQERLQSEGLYNILQAYDDKSAVAVCTLAFCPSPHADPVLFTGECAGRIVQPDRTGRFGFGWDSIFVADGCDVPFSQLPVEEKNALSHRGKAVRQWADWLGRNKDALLARQQGATMLGHKGLDFRSKSPEQ